MIEQGIKVEQIGYVTIKKQIERRYEVENILLNSDILNEELKSLETGLELANEYNDFHQLKNDIEQLRQNQISLINKKYDNCLSVL